MDNKVLVGTIISAGQTDNFLSDSRITAPSRATYTGDIRFREVPGAQLSVDVWGMDNITRKYIVRSDQADAAISRIRRIRNMRDWKYANMFLTNYSITENGPLCEFSISFSGVASDTQTISTEPKISTATRLQQVTLEILGPIPAQDVISYYSPITTITYATRYKPTTRKYGGYIDEVSDSLKIKSRLFWNIPVMVGNYAIGAFNAVKDTTGTIQFSQSGDWWQCTETNELILQPRNFLLNPF